MAPQAGECCDGLTTLIDAQDSIQNLAGNATWVINFSPVVKGTEKYFAEVLFGYFTNYCCVVQLWKILPCT
jgi:hypothetical protein